MTAEVEALLERLDKEWPHAAALIREQAQEIEKWRSRVVGWEGVANTDKPLEHAELLDKQAVEIARLRSEFNQVSDGARCAMQERDRHIECLQDEIEKMREQGAAAARQEPVGIVGENQVIGYQLDLPAGTKLYAAPVPAGDAVSEQEESLHIAVCQAVTLINVGDWQQAHTILRESLIAYADAVMPKPVTTGDAVRVLGYDADEAILACQRASERRTK